MVTMMKKFKNMEHLVKTEEKKSTKKEVNNNNTSKSKPQPIGNNVEAFEDVIEPIEFDISDTNAIRFSIVKEVYNNGDERFVLDMRKFVYTDKYNGPTRNGFSIPLEYLSDFKSTFKMLEESFAEYTNSLYEK